MTFRVAHWDTLDDNLAFSMQGEDIMSILKASVTCLHFSIQEEIFLSILMANVILCTLQSTCRPLCNSGMHLIL
jgi:hypothetical protein